MTFEEILDQAIAMLQRRGRIAYRTLKRPFNLDDDAIEDLKVELIDAQQVAVDEGGKVLVWTGGMTSSGVPGAEQTRTPRLYTPTHLVEKILTSKTAFEGERKQVTVLFADLKGSMELLADRDPEEARQLLDPVLERMMAAVHRYEGTVNQVMGDGIMALFGAPLAHEDHAVRACYAALAMQAALQRYAEDVRRTQGLTVQMRVGLNSGEVVVRAIGNDLHMDYSAVGQTTHLAARMEQLATPGSSLLTAATLRLVEGLVRVQALGPVPVKGLADPVEVFELVGATALRRRLQVAVARGLSPFVGRQPELEALHARLVEVLEALAEDRRDDQVERLAHHALRGEVWDKALAYGRQAGDKAQRRSAYREAVVCYEQALTALEQLPDSRAATEQAIDLRLGLRPALNALGEAPGRMLDHLRRAETLAQTLGDHLRLGQVYAAMSTHFWVAGDMNRTIVYGQRALALAATLGHVGLQARAVHLGRVYYDLGDYARAVEHLERNVKTLQGDLRYERFGTNGSVAASSRAWLSLCHAERGAFTEGLTLGEEGLRIAETANHPFSLIDACNGVSVVSLRQGDVQRAIPVLERGMGLCQDWHIPLFVPWLAATLGVAYALDGRIAAGLALVEHGVKQEVASDRARRLALFVAGLSEAYLLAGRLEDAHQQAGQAFDLARQYQQRGHQAWALWLLGESTARQASPAVEPAAGHYRQALALAEELGMRPLQAHCHRGLGMLYAALSHREHARRELSTAIEMYRTMAMTFWLPQAEAALAMVH